MTNAELQALLELEYPGTSLTAPQWAHVCDVAVSMYARHRPAIVLGSITTAVDVEEYNLPAGGKDVIDLEAYDDWADLTSLGFSLLDVREAQGDVIVDFNAPQQVDIFNQKIAARRRQSGYRFEQLAVGGTVRVMPRPSSVMTIDVLFTRPHTAADTIPETDADLLLEAGRVAAQRELGNVALIAAASTTSGVEIRLGPYTYRPGGLVKAASALLEEATRGEQAFNDKAYLGGIVMKGG